MILGNSTSIATFSTFGGRSFTVQKILEALEAAGFRGIFDAEARIAYGFISTADILDLDFDKAKNVAGAFIFFGIRLDQKKPPAALVRARVRVQVEELRNHGEKVTAKMRREIRQQVVADLLKDKIPSSSFAGIAWDREEKKVHILSTSRKLIDTTRALFDRCFSRNIDQRTPAELVKRLELESKVAKLNLEYEVQAQFLTWLWFRCETDGGEFALPSGEAGLVILDDLTLDGPDGESSRTKLKGDQPTQTNEAAAALEMGRSLASAKIVAARGAREWTFTLSRDSLEITAAKLPAPESDEPMELLAERLEAVDELRDLVEELFGVYLEARLGDWEPIEAAMKEWVETKADVAREAAEKAKELAS